jgi:peptidyl-prolyl cis-trans isomerase C
MRRSAMLRAAGVLILLGAVSACNDHDQEKNTSKVLVQVNGDDITARQLEAELWSAGGTSAPVRQPAVRKQALEALIDRQVLLDEAIRNKIDRDPKVIQIVDRLKTQAIVQAYLESKAANVATASKSEMDAYFDAHPELFAHRKVLDVTQLTVAAKDFSTPLKVAMDRARSLDQVALWLRQHHIDYTKNQRSYSSAELPVEMLGRLRNLDRSRLFVMQDKDGGQAQLCVLNDVRDNPVSRDAASAQIERYLLNKKMQDVAAAEVARLRASAKLVYLEASPTMMVEEDTGAAALPSASTSASAAHGIAESR